MVAVFAIRLTGLNFYIHVHGSANILIAVGIVVTVIVGGRTVTVAVTSTTVVVCAVAATDDFSAINRDW